jgi:hypothetical protein
MQRSDRRKPLYSRLAIAALLLLLTAPLWAQSGGPAPFKDFPGYVAWMQKTHKAPFNRSGAVMPAGGAKALQEAQAKIHALDTQNGSPTQLPYRNIKVNQDRNPWPKVDIASAVDVSDPSGWLVMTIDYRVNYPRMFYHVSTTRGKTWTDDMLVEGSDPNLGAIPLTYELYPGLSFDGAGNNYLSTLSGNAIVDITNEYVNDDTEIDLVQGYSNGTYSALIPTVIDSQPCSGTFTVFVCNGAVSQPMNSTDANPNSPNAGTNYVYYTFYCNIPSGTCTDGTATIPSAGVAILESHSPAAGEPYSAPALVSGSLSNTNYSSMVIDPSGTPHIFFEDYTNAPTINMWESTLIGSVWTVSKSPVASFVYNGLGNANWAFPDGGAAAPGCGIHGHTAYCAFSANQVAGGNLEATPSVYLAIINVNTSASTITRVNNDRFNDMKHHFFGWATATPAGAVYVGWYDDRNDPANSNVQYFVGKSVDGGRTFHIQQAVNDVPFNPCTGFPGCEYFGDYTQLVSGPDGVVHAAWQDARDGATMQIWSQIVLF